MKFLGKLDRILEAVLAVTYLCLSALLVVTTLAGGFHDGYLKGIAEGMATGTALYQGVVYAVAHLLWVCPLVVVILLHADLLIWLVRWRTYDRDEPAPEDKTFKFLFTRLPRWEFVTMSYLRRAYLFVRHGRGSAQTAPPKP